MAVNYGKQIQKSGAAIGTVIAIPKPSSYNSSADDWDLSRFPGYKECDGSALNPNEYYALYSVIGTTYGGTVTGSYPNYSGTFNLPNFRGKFVMGTGNVDGNSGASPAVTPNLGPTGNSAGSGYNIAGSTGGQYTISTVRQLPAGSEITPGAPASPVSTGGSATDTFEIGTYRTSGFTTAIAQPNANISGNVEFTVGPLKAVKVYTAPPHTHVLQHSRPEPGVTVSSTGDGGPAASVDKMPFYGNANGGIISYSRFNPTGVSSGSGATATVTVSGGVITAITVTNGGSGYLSPPSFVLNTGSTTPTSGAAFVVSINSSGSVTGVTVNFGGSGYPSSVTGTFFAVDTGAPLRSHSHKLHELGPGTATWGHDEGGGNTGSQSTSYSGVQPGATDIADTKTKTLAVNTALGVDMNQGNFAMTDASRPLFDSRLVVRLTSADILPIMQPYFRTKYLIKVI